MVQTQLQTQMSHLEKENLLSPGGTFEFLIRKIQILEIPSSTYSSSFMCNKLVSIAQIEHVIQANKLESL